MGFIISCFPRVGAAVCRLRRRKQWGVGFQRWFRSKTGVSARIPHYYVYVNDIKARQRRRKSGPAERVSHCRAESIIDLKQSLPDLKLG
jgi:hypothetical protein